MVGVKYIIFTDGSCRATGIGGIGVVWIKNGEKVFEYSKDFKNTTNNCMELQAIYVALKSIKKEIDELTIVSDSEYAIGVLTKPWNPKKNISLINKIKEQIKITQKLVKTPIIWKHTRGHQSDDSEFTKFNNIADKLAQKASSYDYE